MPFLLPTAIPMASEGRSVFGVMKQLERDNEIKNYFLEKFGGWTSKEGLGYQFYFKQEENNL